MRHRHRDHISSGTRPGGDDLEQIVDVHYQVAVDVGRAVQARAAAPLGDDQQQIVDVGRSVAAERCTIGRAAGRVSVVATGSIWPKALAAAMSCVHANIAGPYAARRLQVVATAAC